MANDLAARLTRGDIWSRALYIVLFTIAYGAAEILLILLVLFQFFAILFTGKANEPLLGFGANLSAYVYQILRYVTFNSEERPFPFSDWPDEAHGGERWLEEPAVEVAAQPPAAPASTPAPAPAAASTAQPAAAPATPAAPPAGAATPPPAEPTAGQGSAGGQASADAADPDPQKPA